MSDKIDLDRIRKCQHPDCEYYPDMWERDTHYYLLRKECATCYLLRRNLNNYKERKLDENTT